MVLVYNDVQQVFPVPPNGQFATGPVLQWVHALAGVDATARVIGLQHIGSGKVVRVVPGLTCYDSDVVPSDALVCEQKYSVVLEDASGCHSALTVSVRVQELQLDSDALEGAHVFLRLAVGSRRQAVAQTAAVRCRDWTVRFGEAFAMASGGSTVLELSVHRQGSPKRWGMGAVDLALLPLEDRVVDRWISVHQDGEAIGSVLLAVATDAAALRAAPPPASPGRPRSVGPSPQRSASPWHSPRTPLRESPHHRGPPHAGRHESPYGPPRGGSNGRTRSPWSRGSDEPPRPRAEPSPASGSPSPGPSYSRRRRVLHSLTPVSGWESDSSSQGEGSEVVSLHGLRYCDTDSLAASSCHSRYFECRAPPSYRSSQGSWSAGSNRSTPRHRVSWEELSERSRSARSTPRRRISGAGSGPDSHAYFHGGRPGPGRGRRARSAGPRSEPSDRGFTTFQRGGAVPPAAPTVPLSREMLRSLETLSRCSPHAAPPRRAPQSPGRRPSAEFERPPAPDVRYESPGRAPSLRSARSADTGMTSDGSMIRRALGHRSVSEARHSDTDASAATSARPRGRAPPSPAAASSEDSPTADPRAAGPARAQSRDRGRPAPGGHTAARAQSRSQTPKGSAAERRGGASGADKRSDATSAADRRSGATSAADRRGSAASGAEARGNGALAADRRHRSASPAEPRPYGGAPAGGGPRPGAGDPGRHAAGVEDARAVPGGRQAQAPGLRLQALHKQPPGPAPSSGSDAPSQASGRPSSCLTDVPTFPGLRSVEVMVCSCAEVRLSAGAELSVRVTIMGQSCDTTPRKLTQTGTVGWNEGFRFKFPIAPAIPLAVEVALLEDGARVCGPHTPCVCDCPEECKWF